MKTTLFISTGLITVSALLAGCSFAARSPDMYRDDTAAAIAKKNDEIKACYDGVLKTTPGASGKVAVKFDVETEHGTITNVTVDPTKTTAPAPVAECVTKSIAGVAISPPDARKGEATLWEMEFTAPPPAAAAAPMPKI
jgi:hypothetical protein